MKNIFTLLVLFAFIFNLQAQENILMGGNMEEDTEYWQVSTLNSNEANSSEYEFDYSDDLPMYGEYGALHFSVTNTGADGAHLMFYQEVTLTRGNSYILDAAVKAMQEMNNSWFEFYIGTEPLEGEDYGSEQMPLGGFKWSGWESACEGKDLFDGMLRDDGCLEGSNAVIEFEGTGDTTVYVAFKAGIWGTSHTVEFVIDNVTLLDLGGGVSTDETKSLNTTVYPNPVNNELNIKADTELASVKIYKLDGTEILNSNARDLSIDVSDLNSGVYIIKLTDINQSVSVQKFQKQ